MKWLFFVLSFFSIHYLMAQGGPTPPNAPTGLSTTAGYNAAHISFTAPTNDGGASITNYEYKINDSSWVALSPAQTSSALTISGLTACNTYTIRIRAVNAAGGGTASDSVVVQAQGGEPAAINWVAGTAAENNNWNSVAYGNGLFVAVSSDGTKKVMTSTDGTTWTSQSASAPNWWQSVTYGNGMFVAVANTDSNRVMTSTDGINWTGHMAAADVSWGTVTYGNGMFVALSSNGDNRIMTSPDGMNWTIRPGATLNNWRSVTYGNGIFVAVSLDGTNRVMTSPDGINWTARSASEASGWRSVTFGNGLFVAVAGSGTNRVMSSPDGINWTSHAAPAANLWTTVTYGNGMFVALSASGTNRIMTSTDGMNWTARAATEANSWLSLTYGNGMFVGVSGSGTNRVMTSSDLLAPGSPEIISITPADTTVRVSFMAPSNTGSSAITNFEYSLDNGSSWVPASPVITRGPLTITGLTAGTTYAFKLRAVNDQGVGCETAVDSFTTIAPANAPTGLSATPGYNAAHISFTAPTNDGGAAITNYEYSINDSNWVALSPAQTSSALTIPGLTACDTYTIRIRAVNAAGGGTASDSVVVTPQGGEPAGMNWEARNAAVTGSWKSVTYGNGQFVALASSSLDMVMTSPDGVTWTGQTITSDNSGWSSITYGNGMYVAVSASGTYRVMTSPDGINWTAQTAAAANSWTSVTYGNGMFVAVSRSGTNRVMTSPDGITWTAREASELNGWNSVTYGNGLFVAVASDGTNRVMTSPDGINWTAHSATEANYWENVTYGHGLFVAVSSGGTNRIMTSPDGMTWTAVSDPLYLGFQRSWKSVTYGNGLFVGVASQLKRVMTSPDGITWTLREVPQENRWTSVIYGNGTFVAASTDGSNRVMSSSDLLTPGTPVISSITPADTAASIVFTAPANAGSSAITNYEYSIDNGTNWVTPSPASTTSPFSITGLTGGTTYAVKLRAVNIQGAGCATAVDSITTIVPANAPTGLSATAGYNAAHISFTAPTNDGGGTITNYEYSINDSSWVALSPAQTDGALTIPGLTACNTYRIRIRAVNVAGGGTASDSVVVTPQGGESAGVNWVASPAASAKSWFSLVYGQGQFVALADDNNNMVMTSPDGVTWTGQTISSTYGWSSITYGNGMYVAVGSSGANRIMTSPDGVTWTIRVAPELSGWKAVTYGNGLFVAVANSGTNRVMTSPDGINWTLRTASEANTWYSVTYGNGLFVAVAFSGTNRVMTSPDGINWTSRSASEANFWRYVTFGNGLFVAVSSDGTNRVMTSPDGITWTARSAAQALTWISVGYGNGLFVAVASQTNQVMTSPDGINWTSRTVPESNRWTSVTYGNGKFVALSYTGTNRVMTSTDFLTPGTPVISSITPADTTASVTFTAPTNAGSSVITNYEYSVDNGTNWVRPTPDTTTSPLSITGLTAGTSYAVKLRAVNTQGAGCATAVDSITTSIPVICVNPTNGGVIASAQSGSYPFDPAAFTSTTAATGETGTLEYKWQSSTTDSTSGFSDIASSNSATYDPGALSQTTWFRRLARVSCEAGWTGAMQSNVLKVTVSKAWIGGNGNWNVGANWSDGLVPVSSDQLTISSGNPQLNVDYEVGGSLTISGTGSLTVTAGKTLTISGTADFGGKSVVFKSNALATAQLGVVSGTLINDDNVTVERFIPNTGRRWRLLTAPVDGISINSAWQNGQTWNGTASLTGDTTGTLITGKQQGNAVSANNRGFDFWNAISNSSSSLQTYNQRAGQGTWVELGNTMSSNAFNSNQGYLVFIRGPRSSAYSTGTSNASTTLRPTGKLRQGTISIRVDGSKGYTLVGNPYASQIDFDSIYSNSGNSALIKRQIWVWDATRGVSGDFQAVMYSAGQYIEVPAKFHASGQPSPLTAIQSGQAFMVVPQSASSGFLTIRESNKISSMPATPNLLLGTNKTPRIYLNLMRRESNGEAMLSDGIMVAYGSGYRMETTDEDDMMKFNNLGDNMVVMNNGTGLIADARPLKDIGSPIALNMWNLSGSAYRFEVKMEGMPASEWEAYLEDLELKTRSALSMQGDITSVDWQILTNGSTAPSERFRIVFERKAVRATPTPEEVEEAQSIRVYPNPVTGRQFTVRLSQLPSDVYTLQLYSIDGRMVMNKRINHENGTGQYKLDLESTLPKGTYQLRCLKGQEAVSITKLVIQ
jgi:Secretion system C-terminal sorting domain/Fibronectin type III domain